MSLSNDDQVFHSDLALKKLALEMQKILRREYGDVRHAVKRMGRRTGIGPRTIRNWYDGRNAPESRHLLLLAAYYPSILRAVLQIIGYSGLELLQERNAASLNAARTGTKSRSFWETYSAKSCTINVMLDREKALKLNQRQLWFLGLLQQGYQVTATEIASFWAVSARSARYDVLGLIKLRLVEFKGARKKGYYELF